MKLQSTDSIGDKVKRRYEAAKLPHEGLIESNQIPEEVGEELKGNIRQSESRRAEDECRCQSSRAAAGL